MEQSDIDNRFTFHPASEDQAGKYEDIRGMIKVVASYLNSNLPESREKSLAVTHLEEAVFWANASIARNE